MASRAPRTVDLDVVVPALADKLRSERYLNATALGKSGVPKAQQQDAIARLVERGFERSGKSGVRLALREQVLQLLEARGSASIKGLFRRTAGATQKDAKVAAEALVEAGLAVIAIRGKEEALVVVEYCG